MRKGPIQGIRSKRRPVQWHRSVAKADHGLQGWKRERICPDLIFAPGGNASAGRILVPEPEGDRLQKPTTVLSDEFELVSTRTIDLSLMPRRDRTTQ